MREDLAKEGACRGGTRPTGGRGMVEGGKGEGQSLIWRSRQGRLGGRGVIDERYKPGVELA